MPARTCSRRSCVTTTARQAPFLAHGLALSLQYQRFGDNLIPVLGQRVRSETNAMSGCACRRARHHVSQVSVVRICRVSMRIPHAENCSRILRVTRYSLLFLMACLAAGTDFLLVNHPLSFAATKVSSSWIALSNAIMLCLSVALAESKAPRT